LDYRICFGFIDSSYYLGGAVTSIGAVGDSLMFGGLAQQIDNYYNS